MFASYDGPLYEIQRASDDSTLNIGLESTGGVANSAPQVSFCAGTTCTITEIYDQTANGNNMPVSQGTGYRIDDAKNVPTGSDPEGVYMLTSSNVTSGAAASTSVRPRPTIPTTATPP